MSANMRTGEIRGWLALLVLIGGGYLIIRSEQNLQMVISNLITMVLSYYFGSSQSNQSNRETIDKMVEAQTKTAKELADKVPPIVSAEVKLQDKP